MPQHDLNPGSGEILQAVCGNALDHSGLDTNSELLTPSFFATSGTSKA